MSMLGSSESWVGLVAVRSRLIEDMGRVKRWLRLALVGLGSIQDWLSRLETVWFVEG